MPETATATDKYQNDMPTGMPDITVSVRQTFGIDSDLQVPAFSKSNDYVPDLDDAYRFDRDTTLAPGAKIESATSGQRHTTQIRRSGPALAVRRCLWVLAGRNRRVR